MHGYKAAASKNIFILLKKSYQFVVGEYCHFIFVIFLIV